MSTKEALVFFALAILRAATDSTSATGNGEAERRLLNMTLHESVIHGKLDVFKELLSAAGSNNSSFADALDDYGMTPLALAINRGRTEMARLLLERPDVDPNDLRMRSTPLENAIWENRTDIAELLLAKPSLDPNAAKSTWTLEDDGRTPLLLAASMPGWSSILELMLKRRDVELDAVDANGRNALHAAARLGRWAGVRALLATGKFDVNGRDREGLTALAHVVQWGQNDGSRRALDLLLRTKGLDVNAPDKAGFTPLMWAARDGNLRAVRALLNRPEIDVQARDENKGRTAFLWAIADGHLDVVEALIAHKGVDVGAVSERGRTGALHVAARNKRWKIVKRLLRLSILDVNARDGTGSTPLLEALRPNSRGHSYEAVASLALRKDVDVNAADNRGEVFLFPIFLQSFDM